MGPGPDQGVGEARERARLFRGLGDPSRLALLDALRAGPLSVGDLARAAGLTQPNTSNHLARLAADGLVGSCRKGRHVIYELADPRVGALLDLAAALGAGRIRAPGRQRPGAPKAPITAVESDDVD